jgi:hypothetical protein
LLASDLPPHSVQAPGVQETAMSPPVQTPAAGGGAEPAYGGAARLASSRPPRSGPGHLDLSRLAAAAPAARHAGRPSRLDLNQLAEAAPGPRLREDRYPFVGGAPELAKAGRDSAGRSGQAERASRFTASAAATARLHGPPGLCGGMGAYRRTLCLNTAMQEADAALRATYERAVRARVDSDMLGDYHDAWMSLRSRMNGDPEGAVRGYYRLAAQLKAATRHAATASLESER